MTTNPEELCEIILLMGYSEHIWPSPMKIQRILYLAYRDYLKENDKPLFYEKFEASKNGPMISNIWNIFDIVNYTNLLFLREAFSENIQYNDDVVKYCSNVWDKYKNLNAVNFTGSILTSDSAWSKAYSRGDKYLKDSEIMDEELY